MSFVRPEARAEIWRWREVIFGLLVVALAAYWFTGHGLLHWVSYPAAIAGIALIWIGVPRARFRGPGGGPGVVQIVERRVSYFGPLTGGMIDLNELSALALDATAHPPHWELTVIGEPPLHIPVSAQGADALFDAFQSLPKLNTGKLVGVLDLKEGRHIVWRKTSGGPH